MSGTDISLLVSRVRRAWWLKTCEFPNLAISNLVVCNFDVELTGSLALSSESAHLFARF